MATEEQLSGIWLSHKQFSCWNCAWHPWQLAEICIIVSFNDLVELITIYEAWHWENKN